jgi:hypothetical protein
MLVVYSQHYVFANHRAFALACPTVHIMHNFKKLLRAAKNQYQEGSGNFKMNF